LEKWLGNELAFWLAQGRRLARLCVGARRG